MLLLLLLLVHGGAVGRGGLPVHGHMLRAGGGAEEERTRAGTGRARVVVGVGLCDCDRAAAACGVCAAVCACRERKGRGGTRDVVVTERVRRRGREGEGPRGTVEGDVALSGGLDVLWNNGLEVEVGLSDEHLARLFEVLELVRRVLAALLLDLLDERVDTLELRRQSTHNNTTRQRAGTAHAQKGAAWTGGAHRGTGRRRGGEEGGGGPCGAASG